MMSIEQMRKTYQSSGLDDSDVDPDPMVQFQRWFEEACQGELPDWVETNAMTLSTCGSDGQVTSRIVLLKGIENGHLYFFTNYDSQKGQQIEANAQVSLGFYWPHLERQVRIAGTTRKTSREQSVTYFHARPRESQLSAVISQQSKVVTSRQDLVRQVEELSRRYQGQEIPCPEQWGGYEVQPDRFEFWQGRPARLHDRLRYRVQGAAWIIERLQP